MPNKLRDIRQGKSLTLLDIYQQTGVHVARLSDFERGKAMPEDEELQKMVEIYGISAQEIIDIVATTKPAPYTGPTRYER